MSNSNRTGGLLIFFVIIIGFFFLVLPFFRFGMMHVLGYGLHDGNFLFPFAMFRHLPLAVFMPTVLMFLLWLFVSIWVYNDAERRGMSGLLWALLVFFGNIVGFLIYLIVRSSSTATVAPAPVNATTCPQCHGVIQPDFKLCPHCGANLLSTCPNCEKAVQSTWKVCPYCGETLKQHGETSQAEKG